MSKAKDSLGTFSRFLLAFSLGCLVSLGAWAQDDADDQADDATEVAEEDESYDLGRIEVTGSLIKREEFTSASPMQIINAETQARVGQLSVADILQNTTVAGGSTQFNDQFTGFVVQGGTGVQTLDLRGLGSTRTLVLLNGRRPGGSGTRGAVSSIDLSMIPEIAAQRFEIVLDGSSSIYGSDAVAGVANIITRRSVDRTEVTALTEMPLDQGGELYRVGAMTGKIFDKGAFSVSAQWELRKPLRLRDRDYLACPEDLAYDENGNRIDRQDRSITAREPFSGCNNLYHNTIIDYFITGGRLIPSPDGSWSPSDSTFPGYRPRANGRYDDENGEAFYEDVLDAWFTGSETAINRTERMNVYATADYSFDFWGGVDWDMDFLYSSRETEQESWRQFFPLVGSAYVGAYTYPNDPDWVPEVFLPLGLPVMPYPSNYSADVDFYYFTTGMEGMLPTDKFWTWQVYTSYSYSDGKYENNAILNSLSGDIRYSDDPPSINYYDPAILDGRDMDRLIAAVGAQSVGKTVYDQWQTTAVISGDLFDLPAGTLGAAFGAEFRRFSIDDQPSQASQNGDLWGSTSAIATKGTNEVWEAFMEAEIPLLSGLPAIEGLTLNFSARTFDYKDGGDDTVWKAGMRWNVTPTFMVRSTVGTSYRAPALFELYLGNQTSFGGQFGLDPCIDWGESDNEFIRRNCEADGVPIDYDGAPSSSATIISGGGVENLNAETSDAMTVGFVWTPEFSNLSIAVDYYDIEVNDQIAQLGAGAILSGCYNAENFPNAFCDLFTRKPGSDPFAYNIDTVRDTFVNINKQTVKGVDVNVRWEQEFDFGDLTLEAYNTYTMENVYQLFDPDLVSGFDEVDTAGDVTSPENVANFRVSLDKNDWNFNYYLQYISETSDDPQYVDEETTYFGFDPAFRDYTMDAAFYHNFSVSFTRGDWDVLVGVNNLFNEEPDAYSSGGVRSRRGLVPIYATQYDLLGRRIFARFNWRL